LVSCFASSLPLPQPATSATRGRTARSLRTT
jgi:hypothetical protein